MKDLSKLLLVCISLSCLTNCFSQDVKISNKEDLFKNCMATFADEVKCSSFLEKSEQDLLTEQEIKRKQREALNQEQLAGLKIRDDIKDALQSKSKKFAIAYLGEPDLVHSGGDQREYLIYNRPISKYAPSSDPDDQITVILRRGKVERVNHVPPEGVETGFSMKKLMQNKEVRLNSKQETETQTAK